MDASDRLLREMKRNTKEATQKGSKEIRFETIGGGITMQAFGSTMGSDKEKGNFEVGLNCFSSGAVKYFSFSTSGQTDHYGDQTLAQLMPKILAASQEFDKKIEQIMSSSGFKLDPRSR